MPPLSFSRGIEKPPPRSQEQPPHVKEKEEKNEDVQNRRGEWRDGTKFAEKRTLKVRLKRRERERENMFGCRWSKQQASSSLGARAWGSGDGLFTFHLKYGCTVILKPLFSLVSEISVMVPMPPHQLDILGEPPHTCGEKASRIPWKGQRSSACVWEGGRLLQSDLR